MSRFQVERGSFSGEETIELLDKNSGLGATILPGFGSNLISLKNNKKNISFIKTPRDFSELQNRPTGFGTPVLMPPGRIKGGSFSFQGREYQFEKNEAGGQNHIHGLVLNRPWSVGETSTEGGAMAQTVFSSQKFPELSQYLPQPFTITLTFKLQGDVLAIETRVENHAPEPMPFWLGFHPYFNVPLGEQSSKADCFISLDTQQRWELAGLVPTGVLMDVQGQYDLTAGQCLEGLLLDDVYTVKQTENRSCARFEDRRAKAGIEYVAGPRFQHWVVYTGKDLSADFVCLEPYTGVPNAANLDLPMAQTGLMALEQGKPFVEKMELKTFC